MSEVYAGLEPRAEWTVLVVSRTVWGGVGGEGWGRTGRPRGAVP